MNSSHSAGAPLAPDHVSETLVRGAVAMIRLYQRLAPPRVRAACRHWPTCSSYAIEALERHGVRGGLALALRRLLSCHPFGSNGVDPVPCAPRTSDSGR